MRECCSIHKLKGINRNGVLLIEASANWAHEDQFICIAASHHALVVDAGKEKSANSPVELVLIALCGCTASDIVSILRKKREPFTHLQVDAKGERATEYPTVFTEIHVTYRVRGPVSHKAMEDAVRLSTEKYCSVSAMLEKTARITHMIEYSE
jgi:putative redox protein